MTISHTPMSRFMKVLCGLLVDRRLNFLFEIRDQIKKCQEIFWREPKLGNTQIAYAPGQRSNECSNGGGAELSTRPETKRIERVFPSTVSGPHREHTAEATHRYAG